MILQIQSSPTAKDLLVSLSGCFWDLIFGMVSYGRRIELIEFCYI